MNDESDAERRRLPLANDWRTALTSLWQRVSTDTQLHNHVIMLVAILAGIASVILIGRGMNLAAAFAMAIGLVAILYPAPAVKVPKVTAAATPPHQSEVALLGEIVKGLPEAAIVLGADGTIEHFNERAAMFCPGMTARLHISSCIRDPHFLDAIDAAAHRSGPVMVTFLRRIPVEQRIEASVACIGRDEGGIPRAHTLVTLRDLSEQESLARMRADFIANASHELRTPLASLQGFIETLQGPARNDPQARERFLDIMAQQSKRMTRLIDDLLSLSRVEMKAHLFPQNEVELGVILGHVIDTLEPLAEERGITLAYEAPQRKFPVRGDRDELVQVFQNLIHNAIKYGHDEGHIDVGFHLPADRVSAGNQRVQIFVRDDGPGIAPEHLPRLVERFYRVDVTDSRQKGGTGLGLAIVKHVLNRHRGELKIVSAPGQGATFTVDLPLLPSALPARGD